MEWIDETELDVLANSVVDAAIALRVACLFARPRGPGSRLAASTTQGFDRLIDALLDDIQEAATIELAAQRLDKLCEVLAETANASERLANMPGAQLGWNELLHGRAELANAYQQATTLRWKAWMGSSRRPAALGA